MGDTSETHCKKCSVASGLQKKNLKANAKSMNCCTPKLQTAAAGTLQNIQQSITTE